MGYAGGKMLADIEDGVGLVTFNQPDKLNAMSVEMWQGLEAILDAFAHDDAVRVVVLTGAGHKAFVSGADISQFAETRGNADAQRDYDRGTAAGRAKLAGFPKPVIARVRGYCLGGGLGIALQADLRIAATDSQFGIPAARLGTANGTELVRQLAALIGPAHAKSLLFTGARIDAVEAGRIGLVNQVVRDQDLNDVVVDLARAIADNAPLSVRAAKMAVDSALPAMDPARNALVEAAVDACADSADYREGRTAFLEKRMPRFTGR
ncbi:MAG: enoyl-CoA hydratase [Acetobacteraceae bacterium]